MRVRIWGSWGSLPAPLSASAVRGKVRRALLRASGRRFDTEAEADAFIDRELGLAGAGTFGGNTPCVEIVAGGGESLICDAGSGLRELGREAVARHGAAPRVYNLFMSHVHWDHIMGFPFFAPAYIAGNTIRIHGCHPVETTLREAFRRQQSAPCFPVEFDRLPAAVEFVALRPEEAVTVAGIRVSALRQLHSGDSYGFRFENGGKVAVYATDAEHKPETVGPSNPAVPFFRGADVVIFDTMYSLAHSISVKEDWGHSSNLVGVELCHLAGARRLCLFHHEPAIDDETIATVLEETRRYEVLSRRGAALEVLAAFDGMELEL